MDAPPAAESALVDKLTRKLIPFLFFLYVIAYLDRVNINFAKLEMSWLTASQYATGAGIFFIGYFLFEVPSNLILRKVGARKWIARIMFTWGLLAMSMIYAKVHVQVFWGLRFLLGIAEAGFFPGVLLYLTYWFTAKERARMVALFMTANAVTLSLGSPLSGLLIDLPPSMGLEGWQQMFLLEGIPAVLMTFVVLWYLPNGPADARWLSESERSLLAQRLASDETRSDEHDAHSLADAAKVPQVWLFCLIYLLLVTGMYGVGFWVADLVKKLLISVGTIGPSDKAGLLIGALCVPIFAASGVAMVFNAIHSDRTQERRFHVAVPAVCGGLGLVAYALLQHQPVAALIAMGVAVSGMWATLGPFWAMPPRVLGRFGGAALAGGIALVNSVGNLGGFFGPQIVGAKPDSVGQLFLLAGLVIGGGLLALAAGGGPARKVDLDA